MTDYSTTATTNTRNINFLETAKGKLEGHILFENLPKGDTDPLWDKIEIRCSLNLDEVGALKNAVCHQHHFVEVAPSSSDLTPVMTKLAIIEDQTRPRKQRYDEEASRLHSDVHKRFFACKQVPFQSELPRLKRFNPAGDKAMVLRNELLRYINRMRDNYIAGNVKEKEYVQREIRDHFFPNTRACLRYPCYLKNEKGYEFRVDSDDALVVVRGNTDHVIQVNDTDFASITLEDKAVCFDITDKDISQAVTQITAEVEGLEKFLAYTPMEYVGILQNGPTWIFVMRKIVRGKVLWTYIKTRPAFKGSQDDQNCRTATAIDESSCIEIERLVEHAYCTADDINEAILDPTKRPMNALQTIQEYRHDDDDDDDDDDNDQEDEEDDHKDAKKGKPSNFTAPNKSGRAAAAAPAKQSSRRGKSNSNLTGSKLAESDSLSSDYFILPLTVTNIARHCVNV